MGKISGNLVSPVKEAGGQNWISFEQDTKVRYCLYARKSTEDDERQALSIDSQIKEMLESAQREGLEVVDVRKESHSAKSSGCRPVFNQILIDIKAGMFNGILSWAPDRLSRNAGDLGTVVDLMDQGHLKQIKTNGQSFTNSPNEKFMLMILCSQAKLENDNKGENVKRGLRAKCELGYRPGVTPLGYLNECIGIKGRMKIFLDPVRAPIIREMFEKVAYEDWSGRDLYRWFVNEKDFTTRTGKRFTISGILRTLGSTFYYGEFEYPEGSGNWYKGAHEPLITKELFEKARANMAVAEKARPGLKEFEFTRLIKCGTCGRTIIADERFRKLKDGGINRHVYYHCTQKVERECHEPPIGEEELIEQMIKLIDKMNFRKRSISERIKNEILKYNRFSEVLFGSQYLEKEKVKSDQQNIRAYAKYVLREGTKDEKRELLTDLKTKLVLHDKQISLEDEK